jgi:hypothetical protein
VTIQTITKPNGDDPNHQIFFWNSEIIHSFFLELACLKSKELSSRFSFRFFVQHLAGCQVHLPGCSLCVSDGGSVLQFVCSSFLQVPYLEQFTSKRPISELKRVSMIFLVQHLYVTISAGRYRDTCSDAPLSGFEALSSKLFGSKMPPAKRLSNSSAGRPPKKREKVAPGSASESTDVGPTDATAPLKIFDEWLKL